MNKGRFGQLGADGAVFFVNFGSLSTMKICPLFSPSSLFHEFGDAAPNAFRKSWMTSLVCPQLAIA
ncbi:MAG TPA: hypothetical protein VHN12_04715, partial [Geobacteraceae bacterium]|nr:hypothetical protein [Geobacteraceae bacterium]